MATISTTTNTTPFQYPGNNLVAKTPGSNRYAALVKASTADNYVLFVSSDQGGTWSSLATIVRTNIVDVGSIFLDAYGWIIWAYRTNESSQDRIYTRVINSFSGAAVSEYLIAAPGNGGVAGATYSGLDVVSHYTSGGYQYLAIAVGTRIGSTEGVTIEAAYSDASGIYISAPGLISGTRRWMFAGSGSSRIGPQIDKEHNGDGYTTSTPNLWVTFGRGSLMSVKIPWTGNGWSGPVNPTTIYSGTAADSTVSRWDGSRFLMCQPDPVNTSQVLLFERNRANSSTTTRHSPTHPTGVVRQATCSYNATNNNVRVFAVGTSTAVLYFVDYVRATDTWGSWTTTGLPAILGANVDNYGAKASTEGDAKFGMYTAASGAPNTLTYTSQTVSFSPNTPTWVPPPNSGDAADVGITLPLTWAFSDPDPGDSQSAYALSKQIGAGALGYWRASDSTWQVAEVQNTSGTTSITLLPAWAVHTDAQHTFKVKVWDSGSNTSGYSSGLLVIPSTPVNPALTAPTAAQVLTTSSVATTWTATEQTQYRITLDKSGVLDTFTRTASSTWGSIESTAGAWTNTGGLAADFSTNGTVGQHSNATVNVLRSSAADVGNSNHDITVDVAVNKTSATGASITQWICGRYTDTNNYYIARVDLSTAGGIALIILKRVAGVLTTISSSVSLATGHVSGDIWRVRLSVLGSTISAKAWPAALSEPPAWALSVVDTDLATGTKIALQTRLETGNTDTTPVTSWDNLLVVPGTGVDYDGGWVGNGAARTVVPPVTLANGDTWVATLKTRNLEGLESQLQRVYVTVSFIPPMTPTTVATALPASGIISVAITNPTPSGGAPALASQDLYRRITGSGDLVGIRVAANLANNATYLDWAAVSGVSYDYRSSVLGVNGTTTLGVFTS